MLLNSGEFYANDLGTGNLELVARFFDKYPSYADKVFLSVKVRAGVVQRTSRVGAHPTCMHVGRSEGFGTRRVAGEPPP